MLIGIIMFLQLNNKSSQQMVEDNSQVSRSCVYFSATAVGLKSIQIILKTLTMEYPEVTIGFQDDEGAVIKIYRLHRLTSHIQKPRSN